MRYAIVVKDISDWMYLHAYGFVVGQKLQRNTLFKFKKVLVRTYAFDHSANYAHPIPLSWCMELNREEYNIFKKLEQTDPLCNPVFRSSLKEAVRFLRENPTERLNEYLMKYLK